MRPRLCVLDESEVDLLVHLLVAGARDARHFHPSGDMDERCDALAHKLSSLLVRGWRARWRGRRLHRRLVRDFGRERVESFERKLDRVARAGRQA